LEYVKPFLKNDWVDIFNKIQTVDIAEERSVVIFIRECDTSLFFQLADEFEYFISILYWYRPNLSTSKKNQLFGNNTIPICILTRNEKLNYGHFKTSGSNQLFFNAITSPTIDANNKLFQIEEKPWQLYWNLIAYFYNPNLKVKI